LVPPRAATRQRPLLVSAGDALQEVDKQHCEQEQYCVEWFRRFHCCCGCGIFSEKQNANLSSKVSQVSFAVGAAGEREVRVSNESAGSAGSSSGLSVSTGQGSLLSDASSVISLKSMGDQLLTYYPHSVGVTPARKKALANISKMNHRGLESRVAIQIMAEQQRKVKEAYG
jgi:hypothetical protein